MSEVVFSTKTISLGFFSFFRTKITQPRHRGDSGKLSQGQLTWVHFSTKWFWRYHQVVLKKLLGFYSVAVFCGERQKVVLTEWMRKEKNLELFGLTFDGRSFSTNFFPYIIYTLTLFEEISCFSKKFFPPFGQKRRQISTGASFSKEEEKNLPGLPDRLGRKKTSGAPND